MSIQLASPDLCWAVTGIRGDILEAKQLNTKLSKTQIDRLGDRLRVGSPSEDDLRLLDNYRRTFGEAYETVIRTIRERLQLEPTGRPAKSTGSLIEKLQRESIRLSQVQDIAGCRVVVTDVVEQEKVVASLCAVISDATVVDRRANPNYGYRAVHVIVQISGKLTEIQVRSSLQHLWAELSEKLSDVVDPTIKYGGGKDEIRDLLASSSDLVADFEKAEMRQHHLSKLTLNKQEQQKLEKERRLMVQLQDKITDSFNKMILRWER